MWAAYRGNESVFDLLIEHHSDVLKKNKVSLSIESFSSYSVACCSCIEKI